MGGNGAWTRTPETKRWLIDRVDGMVEGLRLQLEDDYDSFATTMDSTSDALIGWRNNGLTLITFLFTLAIALATLKLMGLALLEDSLVILAFVAIATFFAFDALHSFMMNRFEHVESAYLSGINVLQYLWGSYYSVGTTNFETTTIATIHVLDEYAKVVFGALCVNILLAHERAIGSILTGEDREEFRKDIERLTGYAERAYENYKERRSIFRESGFLSKDLLDMVEPFEFRYRKEAGEAS